jgi:xylan 1,4-beta-xylosidase
MPKANYIFVLLISALSVITLTAQAQGPCDKLWLAGYGLQEDFDENCRIDLKDLALFSDQWLQNQMSTQTVLHTIFSDNFNTGSYDPDWITALQSNWSVDASPYPNNSYLKAQSNTSIYINFPEFDPAAQPAANDPDGPEWVVSLRYSNGPKHGNNGSQFRIILGNDQQSSSFEMWAADHDHAYCGDSSFVFASAGQPYASTCWGKNNNETGIYWYYITIKYEHSNSTVTVEHYDPATTTKLTNSIQIADPAISRLELQALLGSGKNWLVDDVKIQTLSDNYTCKELINAGKAPRCDLNHDCQINTADLKKIVKKFLFCNHPENNCNEIVTASIDVYPDQPVSLSGQNDMLLLKSFYNSASWGISIKEKTWQWLEPLGVDGTRVINMPRGSKMQNGRFVPSADFVTALKNTANYKLRPHIIAAQEKPQHLPDFENWDQTTWQDYTDYAYNFIKYAAVDFDPDPVDPCNPTGFDNIIIEVGQEDCTAQTRWWITGSHSKGSLTMYEAFFDIYKVWAQAATRFLTHYPQKQITFGGPALTSYTFYFGQLNWALKFAADCANENVRIDFLSWHFYGNNAAIAGRQSPTGPYPSLAGHNQIIRNALDNAGLNDTKIFITEWGPDWHVDNSANGLINANHIGAAWSAAAMTDMLQNNTDWAVMLIFRDHLIESQTLPGYYIDNYTWCSYLTAASEFPKPTYNLFAMTEKMPDQRVNNLTNNSDIGAIGSVNSQRVAVLAWNYNWSFENQLDLTSPQTLQAKIHSLPFTARNVSVKLYLIDEDHSNYYKYVQQGKPIDLQNSNLQKVSEYTLTPDPQTGCIETYPTPIEKSAVCLWLFEPVN